MIIVDPRIRGDEFVRVLLDLAAGRTAGGGEEPILRRICASSSPAATASRALPTTP
jgi:hypothetical protein